jgi:dTDP-glucose pyrophosphorylase
LFLGSFPDPVLDPFLETFKIILEISEKMSVSKRGTTEINEASIGLLEQDYKSLEKMSDH